jgi:hypothetical protein
VIAELATTTPSVADLLVGWRLLTSLVGAMVIAVIAGRLRGGISPHG